MDIEKELEKILDRCKLENDIKGVFYKDKGLFDSSNIWLFLMIFMSLGGFGYSKNSSMPTSITNIYTSNMEDSNNEPYANEN
jgi:hypothetical protein